MNYDQCVEWPDIVIGRDVLNDYGKSSSREWLATNSLGGYAMGSLSGACTRRYHGVLVAALHPPADRRVFVSKVEEQVTVDSVSTELSSNQYPGSIQPDGYKYLESFTPWPAPTFLYGIDSDTLLEKRIWMAHGQNTSYIQYRLLKASCTVALRLTTLICWKLYHSEMQPWPGFPLYTAQTNYGVDIALTSDAPILHLRCFAARWIQTGYWHRNIEHQRENERGLDWREDLYCPGHFLASLAQGDSVTLTMTIEDTSLSPEDAWSEHCQRQVDLLRRAPADSFSRSLFLASDSCVIDAPETRSTIIAGYPWFTDWGRDTMISLPGLCIQTRRLETARAILLAYSHCISNGMLPNRFPDMGTTPEYNTADATLWYFQAIWEYAVHGLSTPLDAPDIQTTTFLRELWPCLLTIVEWHLRGTRFGIHVDDEDGLLHAGEPGVQLTWMDARVDDRVVTPRTGKPVEINALWINALRVMERIGEWLGEDSDRFGRLADKASASFRAKYIRPAGLGLYDIVSENGADRSIRPNQIFAVSLQFSPLNRDEMKLVVDFVEAKLLTPVGLRTLDRDDPSYKPKYSGSVWQRDGAYHQGTVWAWLLGPFAMAHYRVYGDAVKAREFLNGLSDHLLEAGVGYISEVFDAEAPHASNGCIAQAWSIAETLRAWLALTNIIDNQIGSL